METWSVNHWTTREVPKVSCFLLRSGIHCKITRPGNSLAVQWLGLRNFTAEGLSSIPGQGTKIPQAKRCSKTKQNKTPQNKQNKKPGWERLGAGVGIEGRVDKIRLAMCLCYWICVTGTRDLIILFFLLLYMFDIFLSLKWWVFFVFFFLMFQWMRLLSPKP